MNSTFKTIALIGRLNDLSVAQTVRSLAQQALLQGVHALIGAAFPMVVPGAVTRLPEAVLAARAELLVAVGGGGTLLRAARLAAPTATPLLSIGLGSTGLLADVPGTTPDQCFADVLCGRFTTDRRSLLEATIVDPTGPVRHARALNDVVVQQRERGRLLDLEMWIDGRLVSTYSGDGLIVATATGSTGYALSCGGPIIQPNLEAIVLAPISPHMLSSRPIVVDGCSTIVVRLMRSTRVRATVACDGVALGGLAHDGELAIQRAAEYVTLLHAPGYDYYQNLRSRLHWGRGARHRRSADRSNSH